jgi:DMSO/TMAO reductase YedYZ molybdopterin-dependent catalytic subunit
LIESWAEETGIRTRRALLKESFISGSLLISGFHKLSWPHGAPDSDSLQGGVQTGVVDFAGEDEEPMDEAMGTELDGRLFTNLSLLTPENAVTPTSNFYIRTRASRLLETAKPWSIQLAGLVEKPVILWTENLRKTARPMGLHLMECAGNYLGAHFGMLSVADWDGIPLQEILEIGKPALQAGRILISGFDHYAAESLSSVPGASWIFTFDQLKTTGAFLAFKMNGQALTLDHGAPVRLVVPGWYGCACIKWVNEIAFVSDDVPATSQMREYASRTMQSGMPKLAKDYRPAAIDFAAMPIRIEKWLVNGKVKFRVVGIQWGGSRPIEGLEIQFNPEEDYVPVEDFRISAHGTWNFWTHVWTPQKPGRYMIRLRLKDSNVVAKRLSSGYYLRSVEISEI